MIGDHVVDFLQKTQPYIMRESRTLAHFIDRKIATEIHRVESNVANTHGLRLLKYIIARAGLLSLNMVTQDPGELANRILNDIEFIEQPIDIRIGRITAKPLFIKSNLPCYELMAISRMRNALFDLPIDRTWPDWRNVHPLRINDTNPGILKTNFQTGYLRYTEQGPSYAIYSLDCLALIMKTLHYFKENQVEYPSNLDISTFLHSEIIVPSILRDNVTIWFRNVYRQQLISKTPLQALTTTMWDEINPDTVGPAFTYAMAEVQKFKFENNQIMLPFSSFHFGDDKYFIDAYQELYRSTRLPDNKSYIWVDVVKNLCWWEFIILINSFNHAHPAVKRFHQMLRRDIYLWLNLKPWIEIKGSPVLREILEKKLRGLYKYLSEQ